MGWKEVQATYLTRDQSLEGKNIEDLLARRVLDGMGFKLQHLARLEAVLYGRTFKDDTLWTRTEQVFSRALQMLNGRTRSQIERWTIIAQETDAKHRAVMERLALLKDMKQAPTRFPLIFARVADTVNGLVFVYWDHADLGMLRPPYKVVDSLLIGTYDMRLIVQEAACFVRGLADYSKLLTWEDADAIASERRGSREAEDGDSPVEDG